MQLIQINSVYNKGSTGRIVEGIATAARYRGHQARAVSGRQGGTGPTSVYRVGTTANQIAHRVSSLLGDAHGLGSRRATARMIQWLKQTQPDVVGLHNLHGYYLNVPLLFDYLRQTGIPVLWTLHDCWAFTGHCSYFDRFDCTKWKSECHSCPMTGYYPRSIVDRSSRNHRWKKEAFQGLDSLTIVTPSRWLAGHVSESLLGDYPIRIIPNGIDLKVFRPVSTDSSQKPTILGVANQWSDRKGLYDFIQLRSMLPKEWLIRLVGVSESQAKSLPSGIEPIERTESIHELAALYSQARVFVNPTRSDNFPTTNIEALACGTPVVTYRSGGSPESLTEATGKVVDQGDVSGLEAAVRDIVSNPTDLMEQHCREHAVANFSAPDRFDEYVRLAESVFSGFQARRS